MPAMKNEVPHNELCHLMSVHVLLFCRAVFEIKLGTVDQADVDVEWRLRPYMNTARKRLALSTE